MFYPNQKHIGMKKIILFVSIVLVCSLNLLAVEGDTTAPVLHYISVSPDTAANGDSISIYIKASDSESLLDNIIVSVTSPGFTQVTSVSGGITPGDPEDPYWEDLGDSIYMIKMKLNDYAISGDWFVSGLWIYDENSNSVNSTYLDSTLHTFYVNSAMGDDDPPQFIDLYFSSDTVNNGDSVKIYLEVRDTISGLSNAFIILSAPSYMQTAVFKGVFDQSTAEEKWNSTGLNLYTTKVKITDFAEEGDWKTSHLSLRDKAGNQISLGDIIAFYVRSSSPDLDPPALNEVIINPDTITAGEDVEILINAEDTIAGVSFIQIALNNKDEMTGYAIRYGNVAALGEIVEEEDEDGSRKWEYQGDNWYKNVLTLPDSLMGGHFETVYVRVRDSADNSYSFYAATVWDSLFVRDCYITENVPVTICEGESYFAGGAEQTISGIYYDTVVLSGVCDSLIITTLEVTVCIGFEESVINGIIKIYPNPVKDFIYLEFPKDITNCNIALYNMQGELLFKENSNIIQNIDMSNYPAGIYYVRFMMEERIINHRVIKISTMD